MKSVKFLLPIIAISLITAACGLFNNTTITTSTLSHIPTTYLEQITTTTSLKQITTTTILTPTTTTIPIVYLTFERSQGMIIGSCSKKLNIDAKKALGLDKPYNVNCVVDGEVYSRLIELRCDFLPNGRTNTFNYKWLNGDSITNVNVKDGISTSNTVILVKAAIVLPENRELSNCVPYSYKTELAILNTCEYNEGGLHIKCESKQTKAEIDEIERIRRAAEIVDRFANLICFSASNIYECFANGITCVDSFEEWLFYVRGDLRDITRDKGRCKLKTIIGSDLYCSSFNTSNGRKATCADSLKQCNGFRGGQSAVFTETCAKR